MSTSYRPDRGTKPVNYYAKPCGSSVTWNGKRRLFALPEAAENYARELSIKHMTTVEAVTVWTFYEDGQRFDQNAIGCLFDRGTCFG